MSDGDGNQLEEETVLVDYVAYRSEENRTFLVLIEAGPWIDTYAELQRLQDRLYGALDIILDGKVAEMFPQTFGSLFTIKLICEDMPKAEVEEFFTKFSKFVFQTDDYRIAKEDSKYCLDIDFSLEFAEESS